MEEDFAATQRIDTAPSASTSGSSKPAAPVARTFAAPTKLEPYLLLAKSARGAGAASLIDQVTAAQGVFAFGEVVHAKSILELENNEQYRSKWLLLQVFAYGTLQDYRNNASILPPLSPAQLTKLRQLTLLELASQTRAIPYSILLPALELSSIRELEDLIIECIYADLLKARINQKKQILEVESVVGRDVRVSTSKNGFQGGKDIGQLYRALEIWQTNVGDTLKQLDWSIAQIRQKELNTVTKERAQTDRIHQVLNDIQRSQGGRDGNSKGGQSQQSHPAAYRDRMDSFQNVDDMDADAGAGGGSQKKSPSKANGRKRTRQ